MRTTFDLDDDLLLLVKKIARQQKLTTGDVVSNLLREVLPSKSFTPEYRHGVPLLRRRPPMTGFANRLFRDES